MGCATALALAERGADAIVLERAVPGAEASSAAAGILGAQIELHGKGEDASLFLRARDAWAPWARELRDATGIDVGWRACGVMRVAFEPEQAQELEREVSWQQQRGLRAERLDGEGARKV